MNHSTRSIRPKAAAALLGISLPTYWRWIKSRPDFPRVIRLSARCTVQDEGELLAWRDKHVSQPKEVAA